jgi:hypothetical protein
MTGNLGSLLYKDPITAQGISDVFIDAENLTNALNDGWSARRPLDDALAEYQSRRDRRAKPMYFTCTHLSFQKHRVLGFHRTANDFQNLNLHLASLLGGDVLFVTGKQDTFLLPDVSFEKVCKLAEQRRQFHTDGFSQPGNESREVAMFRQQLFDRRSGLVNSIHGGKHDFLFRFEVRRQISFEETDHFLCPLGKPHQIGFMVLHAAMDSQTNQQAVVMLARKGGETFVSPSGIHSGTCLKLCRAGTGCCSPDEYADADPSQTLPAPDTTCGN